MTLCRACGHEFPAVTRGGNVKEFCSDKCRNDYHTACRKFTEEMIDRGMTTPELVMAFSPSCTTARAALEGSEVVGVASDQ